MALKSPQVAIAFTISLALLAIAFFFAQLYCQKQSHILHTYSSSINGVQSTDDDVLITVTSSKQWDDSDIRDSMPTGAQYDGVITNKSTNFFHDWKVVLVFSEECVVDSSWNGSFLVSGKQVVFIAQDIVTVDPESSLTFGAVMYSDHLMSLESYTVEGYQKITVKDLALFNVLIVLSLLWCIALIIGTVLHYKTKVYNTRLELDSQIILQSMNTLTSFIDAKDRYTKNHSTRVAIYSSEIGRRLKLDKDKVENLYYIALMHDCGKVGIPDKLLNSTEELSEKDYKTLQSHTDIGKKMLANFTAIPNIRDGVYYHHEHYDGKGYPEGLKGSSIPLCARIICVADTFDAMSSNRCYRSALSREEILTEMKNNSGKQFDPEINNIMIGLIESGFVEKIKLEYPVI